MKRILLTLCVFIALASLAHAGFYHCVGKDGKTFITDNPPQDAKCETSGGDNESANQQQGDVENQQNNPDNKTTSPQEDIKRLKSIPRPSY